MELAIGQPRVIVVDKRPREEHLSGSNQAVRKSVMNNEKRQPPREENLSGPNKDARNGVMNGQKRPPPTISCKGRPNKKQPLRRPDQLTKAQKKQVFIMLFILFLSLKL